MKLLTKEILAMLPKLYSQEKEADPMVYVKFFTPYSNWTWFITEGEQRGGDFLMFGLVLGFEEELGYVSLNELQAGTGFAAVERDLYFTPGKLSEVRERYRKTHGR